MSILIKGMEMPTGNDALTLFIYPDGRVVACGMLGPLDHYDAVPVPEHGRLIDADEFFKALTMDDCVSILEAMHVQSILSDTPTIIPAEEGEGCF